MSRLQVLLLIFFLCLTTSLPYITGYIHQSPNQVFVGRIPSNPADTAAYFSNIEQARQGRWLFTNQLTSEAQQLSLFHPLWLVLGWFGWLTHLNTPLVFQIGRLATLVLFVFVLNAIVRQIYSTRREQILAMIVVTTNAGLGWGFSTHQYIGAAILHAPLDIWIDEANTFRSLSHSAQFILSQTLLLLILWSSWRRTQGQAMRHDWLIGSAIALLGFIHPYDLVTAIAVMVVWIMWWLLITRPGRRAAITTMTWLTLVWIWALPVATYYLIGPWQQLAVRGWFEQNINPSPSPLSFILGFGLLIPLGLVGGIRYARRYPVIAFLLVWIVTVMVIMYIPGLSIQRRLLSGVHMPMAFIAAFGLMYALESIRFQRTATTILALLFLAVTNGKTLQAEIREARHPEQADYPLYITRDESETMNWLRQHSSINDVVLASFWNGNAITGLIARPVTLAHGNQTLHSGDREKDWAVFSAADSTAEQRQEIINRLRIRWLFWTADDQAETAYRPAGDPAWHMVFQRNGVTVFQLQTN